MQQASASVSLLARRCVFYITSQRDPLGDNKPTLTGQQPLELLWVCSFLSSFAFESVPFPCRESRVIGVLICGRLHAVIKGLMRLCARTRTGSGEGKVRRVYRHG